MRFLHDFCGDGRRDNSFLLPAPSIKKKTLRTEEGRGGNSLGVEGEIGKKHFRGRRKGNALCILIERRSTRSYLREALRLMKDLCV